MWIESFDAIDKEGVIYEWKNKMHQFINHLADGKTIDEALGLLE